MTKDNMEYTFERVREEHYADLCRLAQQSFGEKKSISFFQNKMDTAYLGVRHLGFVAYDESHTPAAFYGVYPYMMSYGGQNYLAAQSGDTMTHPAHGGRGLFTRLARMTYELAKEEGIQFIFGFPNNNSLPGFVKKLNWTHRENMLNYKTRVYTFPLAALCKKLSFLQPLYASYVKFMLQRKRANNCLIKNSVLTENTGGVLRSKEWMSYKFFSDNSLITLAGSPLWVKVDGALLIGEWTLTDPKFFNEALRKVKRLAWVLGCHQIIFPVSPGTGWDKLLRQRMPPTEGIYIGYLDLQSGLPLQDFKYVMADSDTF